MLFLCHSHCNFLLLHLNMHFFCWCLSINSRLLISSLSPYHNHLLPINHYQIVLYLFIARFAQSRHAGQHTSIRFLLTGVLFTRYLLTAPGGRSPRRGILRLWFGLPTGRDCRRLHIRIQERLLPKKHTRRLDIYDITATTVDWTG